MHFRSTISEYPCTVTQIKHDFSSFIKKKNGKLKSNFFMNMLYFCEKKCTIDLFLYLIVNILFFLFYY